MSKVATNSSVCEEDEPAKGNLFSVIAVGPRVSERIPCAEIIINGSVTKFRANGVLLQRARGRSLPYPY